MIERILIHRFRGIRQGDLKDLRKLNLFIGPNNSGKTAILELLYLSATSGRPVQFIRDDLLPAETGALAATTSIPADLLGYEPLSYLRRRHGKPGAWAGNPAVVTAEGGLEIDLRKIAEGEGMPPWETFRLSVPLPERGRAESFSAEDIARIAMVTLPSPRALDASMIPPWIAEAGLKPASTAPSETDQTTGALIAEQSQSYTTGGATSTQTAQATAPATEPDVIAADWHYLWDPDFVYRWDRQQPLDRLAVWVTQGQRPHPERVLFYNFTSTHALFTEQFARWAYRTVPDWHEKIAARMASVFPALTNAKIEVLAAAGEQPGATGYVRLPGRTPLAIDHFGDGARHAFTLLAALIALAETVDEARPGLVLWEEPEVHQNPISLTRLLDAVFDITRDKPIQVCIATHNLEVLAHLTRLLQRNMLPADDTLVFRMNLRDGIFRSAWFNVDNLTVWLEAGHDPRVLEEFDSPLQFQLRED